MTKIDIISGFLGAGKTTFIKKLLEEAISCEQVVLIENEFGQIGIDGGFLKDAGIEIREMNSGCICCSLVGDFGRSLEEVLTKYKPDRVIIEPSGVGKLSDVMKAVRDVAGSLDVELNSAVTMVDASKCKMYMKNFGEFFNNQIEHAGTIVLSRTDVTDEAKVQKDVEMIREHNQAAAIITTPYGKLTGDQLLEIIEKPDTMAEDLMKEVKESRRHHHDHEEGCGCGDHHHHHEQGEGCGCERHEHHHHDHEEGCGCGGHEHHGHHEQGEECGCEGHEYHHHDHGEECGCGGHERHGHHEQGEECGCEEHEHHHHHDHGEECSCGCHDRDHHHADEVFTSWGMENVKGLTRAALEEILDELANGNAYGDVLRAKGMVPDEESEEWFYFDLVPDEFEIRVGKPDYTGKVCVIGARLREDALNQAFGR